MRQVGYETFRQKGVKAFIKQYKNDVIDVVEEGNFDNF